jgi:hypothetical protein
VKGDFLDLLLSNQAHRSSSDPEARLLRKSDGTGAYLCSLGHCFTDNLYEFIRKVIESPPLASGSLVKALVN